MLVTIRHVLALDLWLLDTATGQGMTPTNFSLWQNDKLVHPIQKGGGHMILLGESRTDFTLRLEVHGYLPITKRVCYEELDSNLPHITQHLVPDRQELVPYLMREHNGKVKGLRSVMGVPLDTVECFMREYDAKKKLITITNSHELSLDRRHFALIDPYTPQFEPFVIIRGITPLQFQVEDEIKLSFNSLYPVAPVVFGAVMPDETFWFRVRDDGNNKNWLLRFETETGEYFEKVTLDGDFTGKGENGL